MRIIGTVALLAMGIMMSAQGQAQRRGDAEMPYKGSWRGTGTDQGTGIAHGKLGIGTATRETNASGCEPSGKGGACAQDLPWRGAARTSGEPRWLQK